MKRLAPVAALILAACGGGSEPAAPPRPPLPSTNVPADDLARILLTPTEAQPIIAKVGLTGQPFSDFEAADGMRDDPTGCAKAVYPALVSAYRGSAPHTLSGVTMRDEKNLPRLTQAAVAYDLKSDAQRQLARLTDDLERCAETTVTVVTTAFDNVWHTHGVGSIEQGVTLTADLGTEYDWMCHRAIALRANVILDVQACAGSGPDPTPNLIDAMTEKMR